jgi:hypothetical protein
MENPANDLVEVLVPRHLLVDVYRLIADRAGSPVPPRAGGREEGSSHDGLPDDWSASLVRRMYSESAKHMRAILDALAARPGEVVTASELIEVLASSRGDAADSSVLGGTLGAFGRRVANRYGRSEWPFSAQWDSDSGQVHYRMSPGVAALIRDQA